MLLWQTQYAWHFKRCFYYHLVTPKMHHPPAFKVPQQTRHKVCTIVLALWAPQRGGSCARSCTSFVWTQCLCYKHMWLSMSLSRTLLLEKLSASCRFLKNWIYVYGKIVFLLCAFRRTWSGIPNGLMAHFPFGTKLFFPPLLSSHTVSFLCPLLPVCPHPVRAPVPPSPRSCPLHWWTPLTICSEYTVSSFDVSALCTLHPRTERFDPTAGM